MESGEQAMKDIQIMNLRIESLENQSALFSGNNLSYQNHVRRKKNQGFGNLLGKNNQLLYQRCTIKNREKS